ncbi:MAG: hypothetical protein L0Z62_06100, partial [Gemmataceae bacterium]|nr:hypothetical protein [Gemmataceae bacterium]
PVSLSPCLLVSLSPCLAEQPDPLPIQRLLIPPDRVPRELERARQGVLVQLTRAEFEARVQRALQAGEALKNPPRLAEARYRATLVDTALVGTGQWTILHAVPAPGILTITPLNLALRQARLENSPAILGSLDGKTLGLLVERPGKQTLALDWSARSESAPGELHFDLRLPACALTSLELDLPVDHRVTVRDTCQLSGPQPAETPDRRRWRIECAGRSQIYLMIRRLLKPDQPPPLVLAQLETTQTLEPDLVETEFVFHLEVLQNRIRELVCECDPALKPVHVSLRNRELESWESRPGATPGAPSTLLIRLREPVDGPLQPLRLRCQAPLPADKLWTCPGVRLVGAVSRGETLVLRVPTHVRLQDWQPGSFRLTDARTEASGRQILTLTGSGPAEPPNAAKPQPIVGRVFQPVRLGPDGLENPSYKRRPRARVTSQGLEYRARQLAWWRLGPESSSLTVQITYEVLRGRLFQIPVRLPAGWKVAAVEEEDAPTQNRLRHWTVLPPDHQVVTALLELKRPLEPSADRWTVQLHLLPVPSAEREAPSDPGKALDTPRSLPFPEIASQEARLREGVLAISVDPSYQTRVEASLPAAASDRLPERETGERDSEASTARASSSLLRTPPWSGQAVDYVYSYRGEPVSGTLHLHPRRPQVRAHCTSKVVLASGRAAVLISLAVQPETGNPETLDLYLSTPVAGAWNWKTERGANSVRSTQRLHIAEAVSSLLALGASTAVEATSLLAPQGKPGTLWRLRLAQPLREPLLLEATLELTGQQFPEDPLALLLPLAAGTPLEAFTRAAVTQHVPLQAVGTCRWEVPLLTVLATERMDGEVSLHLAGADMVQVETTGLREVTTGPQASASSPWRAFRYRASPVGLVLWGQLAASDRTTEAVVDQSQLHIYVEPTGRLLYQYRFALWNWRQRTLPLHLPAGARALTAKADGQWLTRLALAEPVPGTTVIELPVAGRGRRLHHFEVVYAVDMPSWRFWTRLEAPVPGLPVRTVAFRRIWHLPPGLAPLAEEAYARLPGPGYGDRRPATSARRESFFTFPFALAPLILEQWGERQRQVFTDAGKALRQQYRTKKLGYLGEALDLLALEAAQEQEVLVLDAVALDEAGLRPETPFPAAPEGAAAELAAPLWESLGLVYVSCRPAALLTTLRQFETWQTSAGPERPLAVSVENAIAEAVAQGHDSSGRFRVVTDWLRENEERGAKGAWPAAVLDLQAALPWTAWEPRAAATGEEKLFVVRQEVVPGVALALAGFLAVVGWRVRRCTARLRLELLLAWLTLGGLALLWLPAALRELVWWPTTGAAALAAAWYLRSAIRFAAPPRPTGPKTVAATGLALALSVGWTGQASAPEPVTVWLVPGAENAAQQLVLAPPELLDQLQTLAQRGAPSPQGIVLLSAEYEGKIAQSTAGFQAEFRAYCFRDEAVLTLPLGGVRLEEALVDGAMAFPVALPEPRAGFTMKVPRRGWHTIRLRWSARVQGTGEDHEVRISIPEVAQSHLTLQLPPGARYLQSGAGREGAQRVTADAGGVQVHADLGRVATLHARWRQDADPAAPPVVQLQEIYLWDLQPAASRLLGLLQYTVPRGAPNTFTFGLPEQLEVHKVEPIASKTGPTPRLKDWLLSGTGLHRQVQLVFQNPVTESVQIFLELVPNCPLGTSAVLPLPTPLDAQVGEG